MYGTDTSKILEKGIIMFEHIAINYNSQILVWLINEGNGVSL